MRGSVVGRTVVLVVLMLVFGGSSVRARPGFVPFRGGIQAAANPVCNNPRLSYFGGPLLQRPRIVAVYWNSNVNASLLANLPTFFSDVTASSYWAGLSEYDSVGLTPGTNQAILPGSSVQAAVLSPLTCPSNVTAGCNLTDAQVQAELARQINLGQLPAPGLDCTGNADTVYMIEFPPNVRLSGPGTGLVSCQQFCAYHWTGTFNGKPLVYAALMDMFTGACSTGCGGSPTALANATTIASHELAEAVTDPDVGLDTGTAFQFPAGWGDNNNGCGEIADICASGGSGDTIAINGRSWVVQQLWSNALGRCTSLGPRAPVCSGTTLTGCRRCSCADSGQACGGATPVCETIAGNVAFGACEACTSTSATCSAGATCQQSSTLGSDDVCVGGSVAVPALGGKRGWLMAVLLVIGLGAVGTRRARARGGPFAGAR